MASRTARTPTIKTLATLYTDAQCEYWGPIIEWLEEAGLIGPEGIIEEALKGVKPFMSVERFMVDLQERGVPYKL